MNWQETRYRYVLAMLAEGACRREIAAALDVYEERARQLITEARSWRSTQRRTESPTAEFYYTERFG